MIGAAGIVVAFIIGITFSLGGEGTVLLMFLMYVLGFSVGPRVVFEFANPKLKIYLAAGPVGLAFVKLAIKVFSADGEVSDNEVVKLKQYIGKEFGREIGRAAELYIKENPKIEDSIYGICKPLSEMKSTHRVTIMYQLFAMAASDREYSDEEEQVLKKIGRFLHIGKKRFYFIKSTVIKEASTGNTFRGSYQAGSRQSSSGKGYQFLQQFFVPAYNPFFILGVANTASNEEIKKAYRDLAKRYHPDLSMHKSDQYRKKVVEKIQEINEAYETIKKIKGIK